MAKKHFTLFALFVLLECFFSNLVISVFAVTESLGNGYFHHGVATPVSNHRVLWHR